MQVLRNVWIMRKTNQARKPLPKGLSGRLTKGAGTHLASWLQEVTALTVEEAQTMLDTSKPIDSTVRGARAHAGLVEAHGKRAGHSKPITDIAHSGDLIATKDPRSMRLWRAHGDFALLRVVTCRGRNVSFHESGQYIVTGSRTEHIECIGDGGKSADAGRLQVWGPAGGSAFGVGKRSVATGTGLTRPRKLEQQKGKRAPFAPQLHRKRD